MTIPGQEQHPGPRPEPDRTWLAALRQFRDVVATPRPALLRALGQEDHWQRPTLLVLAVVWAGGVTTSWFAPSRNATLMHLPVRLGIAASSGFVAAMLCLLVIVGASALLRLLSGMFALGLGPPFGAFFRLLVAVSFPAALGTVIEPLAEQLHGHSLQPLGGHAVIPVTVFFAWSTVLLGYGLWLVWLSGPGRHPSPGQ